MFDEKKAERAISFIELLKLTDDFHGQPFSLMDWQRVIIRDVYGTMNKRGVRQYRYVYLEVAKKNAKSQLVGAIALLHLFDRSEPNGQIYGCAGDRAQASLVYDLAVEMIEQDEALSKRVKINDSYKRITNLQTDSFYQVVSAEAYTKHGLNISACIFDELHVQPNRDLWDVMTKGAGLARRQPIWWVITTAGDDPERASIGWEIHEKADGIIKARAAGDKEKDIPNWYPKIYSYTGEDIYNDKNWKQANPGLGTTIQVEDLRELATEAKLHPSDERIFRWLNLNQWVTTKLTGWLPIDLWDATNAVDWTRGDLLGEECYIGGDFSTTTDLTGACLIFPPQWHTMENEKDKNKAPVLKGHDDWRVMWDCWIPEDNMKERIRTDHVPYDEWAAGGWLYPTDGDQIDFDTIEEKFEEYHKLYKVIEVGADKSFVAQLLQHFQKVFGEDKVVDVPQTYTLLTDPMNEIERLLRGKITVEGKEFPMLTHEPHPVARWCFGNTSIHKNGNAQIKYVKETRGKGIVRTKRIDLTAAWVISMSRAKFHASKPDLSKILSPDWGM